MRTHMNLIALGLWLCLCTACALIPPTDDLSLGQPTRENSLGETPVSIPDTPISTPVIPASEMSNPTPRPMTLEPLISEATVENDAQLQISGVEMAARARTDLSAHLNMAVEDIETISIEERTWRDGVRSCAARRGMLETVQPVQGWLILLRAQGKIFEYRADEEGQLIRCPQSGKPIEPIR